MITEPFWTASLHLLPNCCSKIMSYETYAQCNNSGAGVTLLPPDEIKILSVHLKNPNTYEKSVFSINMFHFYLQLLFKHILLHQQILSELHARCMQVSMQVSDIAVKY
jgi:hypothetical protein